MLQIVSGWLEQNHTNSYRSNSACFSAINAFNSFSFRLRRSFSLSTWLRNPIALIFSASINRAFFSTSSRKLLKIPVNLSVSESHEYNSNKKFQEWKKKSNKPLNSFPGPYFLQILCIVDLISWLLRIFLPQALWVAQTYQKRPPWRIKRLCKWCLWDGTKNRRQWPLPPAWLGVRNSGGISLVPLCSLRTTCCNQVIKDQTVV